MRLLVDMVVVLEESGNELERGVGLEVKLSRVFEILVLFGRRCIALRWERNDAVEVRPINGKHSQILLRERREAVVVDYVRRRLQIELA